MYEEHNQWLHAQFQGQGLPCCYSLQQWCETLGTPCCTCHVICFMPFWWQSWHAVRPLQRQSKCLEMVQINILLKITWSENIKNYKTASNTGPSWSSSFGTHFSIIQTCILQAAEDSFILIQDCCHWARMAQPSCWTYWYISVGPLQHKHGNLRVIGKTTIFAISYMCTTIYDWNKAKYFLAKYLILLQYYQSGKNQTRRQSPSTIVRVWHDIT